MIFDALISFMTWQITTVLNFFPNSDTNVENFLNSKLSDFNTYMGGAAWILPMDTFLTALTIFITITSVYFTYRLIRYVAGVLSLGVLK